ncbi:hypothetical protein D3C75_679990 [compost metagenome]
MYEKDADAHQAALFGLKLSEIPAEVIEVWDCNWPAFSVFHSMSTQWRVGMGGATGLDYTALPVVAKMIGYKNKDVQDMFPDIQVMENEALITMGENKQDANDS